VKGLSLFANVGIGETYFDQIGIDIVVANELIEDRAEFYRSMHPNTLMIEGSILDNDVFCSIIRESQKREVDFIMATPPCQGMSAANAKRAEKNDPRNSLIKKVIQAAEILKPKYVLIENVRGMASENTYIIDDAGNSVNIMPHISSKLGDHYNIVYKVLDAADYGTAHYRKRLITLLSRKDMPAWNHPEPEQDHITVRESIGHLPSLESGQDSPIKWHSMVHKIHNDNHIKWIRNTPTGKTAFDNPVHYPKTIDRQTGILRRIKGFRTTYKRIDWDKPAPTVTMLNGSINSQNNCHPGTDNGDGTFSDARVLTIKELLHIVGLPDDWVDHLEHTKRRENFLRHVIGECFPPLMALSIVKEITNER
jgi:DNA (cytosine-5)-methyltransferase 1